MRTSHLDSSHAYGNGANLFFYVEGRKDEPQEVAFRLPKGWKTSMALPARGGVFRAANYDELVDSPFECGTHRTIDFRVRGVPHTLAIWGEGNEEPVRLVRDLRKLVEEAASLFGGLPYERYLFLVHLAPGARGGLEHRASQSVAMDPWAFRPPKAYRDTLLLFSHELFHAWNVKRIRPEALGPFDYTKEVHTKDLWALEGITSYYEVLLAVRAGLLTPAQGFETWMSVLDGPPRDAGPLRRERRDVLVRRLDPLLPAGRELRERRGELLQARAAPRPRARPRACAAAERKPPRTGRRHARSSGAAAGSKGKAYPEGAVEDAAARVIGSRAQRAPVLRPPRARNGVARSRATPAGGGPRAASRRRSPRTASRTTPR